MKNIGWKELKKYNRELRNEKIFYVFMLAVIIVAILFVGYGETKNLEAHEEATRRELLSN